MQNRKDSLILKQKGNYIPLLKHGESVQVNEERGYCCPRIAKSRSKSKNIAGTVPQEKLQKQEIYTEKRTDNRKRNRQSQEPIKTGVFNLRINP